MPFLFSTFMSLFHVGTSVKLPSGNSEDQASSDTHEQPFHFFIIVEYAKWDKSITMLGDYVEK